jgi:hypothetical protein
MFAGENRSNPPFSRWNPPVFSLWTHHVLPKTAAAHLGHRREAPSKARRELDSRGSCRIQKLGEQNMGCYRGLKECQDIWWHLEMYIALVILSLPLDVFITFGYNHVQDLAVLWHIRHSETICHLQGSYPKNKHDCLMVHRNCGLVHPVGLVQVWLGWTNPPALEKPFECGDL